jgi:hypothetical protein
MACNITLEQYHKRIQLWCLFQLTQIDHNYPYISFYRTKTNLDTVSSGEIADLSYPRMHNPDYPYVQADYFPYISEESKQHSHEVLEQEFDTGNTAHEDKEIKDPGNVYDLPYHLSSQASQMLMNESSACGNKAILNNPKVSEETKEHAKEQVEQMG